MIGICMAALLGRDTKNTTCAKGTRYTQHHTHTGVRKAIAQSLTLLFCEGTMKPLLADLAGSLKEPPRPPLKPPLSPPRKPPRKPPRSPPLKPPLSPPRKPPLKPPLSPPLNPPRSPPNPPLEPPGLEPEERSSLTALPSSS